MRVEKELKFKVPEGGPEKWAKEMPVETVGTEKERRENYKRFLGELGEERKKLGLSEEEFKKRLEKAEKFVEKMPIFHFTSLRRVVEIFKSGKLFSTSELKKPEFTAANTLKNDIECGLDKFIFLTNEIRESFAQPALIINNKILNRPDCVVTPEDIVFTSFRCFEDRNWLTRELDLESLKKIQEEYKKTAISGKDFKEFLSQFIATNHRNPEEFIDYSCDKKFANQKGEHYIRYRKEQKQPIPLFPKEWYTGPEIKVMKEMKAEDISSIILSPEYAGGFIPEGIPKDLIKFGRINRKLIKEFTS